MSHHEVFLLAGSNIQPEQNIRAALGLLRNLVTIQAISPVWETPAIGSEGPNFLNLAVRITAKFSLEDLKYQVLRKIEAQLGRVRSEDKNAPRPMDLDILLFDNMCLEPDAWFQAHIACPLSGLLPDLVNSKTDQRLYQLALYFQQTSFVRQRPDLHFDEFLF
jgi:2-amino-4-hydroxy-6-hydroxymethyldihydropteridine diphosphokinase